MKKLMIAIGIISFILLLSSCQRELTMKPDLTVPYSINQDIKQALYYASLAPSSHNAQMWKVKVNEKQIEVKIDPKRLLSKIDPDHREAYLSLGAFVENLKRAFIAFGYKTEIHIGDSAIQLSFFKTNTDINNRDLSIIEKRHTDKRPFLEKKLESDTLSQLLSSYSGHLHYFEKNSEVFKTIQQQTIEAYKIQLANIEKRRESAAWFRLSDKEALDKRDGLPAEQLGIKGIKKVFYYLYMNKDRLMSEKFATQSVNILRNQLNNCTGFFVITGADNDFVSLVRMGMLMESFWLDASAKDVALHPVSQLIEEEILNSQPFKLSLPTLMIFRVGYVNSYQQNNKIRRNISNIIEN